MRGHGVVELGIDRAQHPAVGELRHELIDRRVEVQGPVLDEGHCGDGGDRFGERCDPEDRVARERPGVGERGRADRVDVDIVAAGHQGDEPGHVTGFHVARHRLVQPVPAGRGDVGGRRAVPAPCHADGDAGGVPKSSVRLRDVRRGQV